MKSSLDRELGILGLQTLHDRLNAGTWLRPGARGCKAKGCDERMRRDFRPTFLGGLSSSGERALMAQTRRLECKAKGCSEQMRRGFRPTEICSLPAGLISPD